MEENASYRMLLVEDDPGDAELMRQSLRGDGAIPGFQSDFRGIKIIDQVIGNITQPRRYSVSIIK